jgi:hypothetical protein
MTTPTHDRLFMGKKIVVVTPAGRKQYMEILFKYILRLKPVITEYRLWVNTNVIADINYMKEFQQENSDFVTLEYLPSGISVSGNSTICHFFKNCCESDTVYVRFDDDVVCIDDMPAFCEYLKYRIEHPEYFLVYANIVNNAILTYLHQRYGLLDTTKGFSGYRCMDDIGWNCGDFALNIHKQVIQRNFDLTIFNTMNNWILLNFERVSINAISWLGEEFANFNGIVIGDEEQFISSEKPKNLNKCNIIFGGFTCVHYAFYPQRPLVDRDPSILKAYLERSQSI